MFAWPFWLALVLAPWRYTRRRDLQCQGERPLLLKSTGRTGWKLWSISFDQAPRPAGQKSADREICLPFGLAYDSSPAKDEDRTVALPRGETYRMGLGAQWQVNQAIQIGFSYELAWLGDLKVNQYQGPLPGRVSGE